MQLRVRAILKLKEHEKKVLPGLIENQPDIAHVFGLTDRIRMMSNADSDDKEAEKGEEEAAVESQEEVNEEDGEKGGGEEGEGGEEGKDEETSSLTRNSKRGVRLPRYTGEELEAEMTALFYDNPYVFKHVSLVPELVYLLVPRAARLFLHSLAP